VNGDVRRSKMLLALGAILEAVTGLALIFQPALVVQLLLGEGLSPAGLALGRVAGFGLLSLGLACWPRAGAALSALRAMLTYNLLATVYLAYLRLDGALVGRLLLPTIVLHAVLALLFARAWIRERDA
jgi:hypothetical protein